MNKYTRRTINQKAYLHDKEYVTVEDATEALMLLARAAVEAGADEDKMMEFFSDEK